MEPITIRLSGYAALVESETPLILGTYASYGVEQIQIIPETGWEGLTITATFVTPDSSTRVLAPESGVIDVPQEATSKPLSLSKSGKIVFSGVAAGVQRITTNVDYLVAGHAPVEGSDSQLTPSEWEQVVTEFQNRLDKAVPPDGSPGQVLTATDDGNAWAYPSGGGGSGGNYIIGDGLKYDPDSNILSVDTTDVPEQDNTKPITSAGVYTTLGNIDVLLGTI